MELYQLEYLIAIEEYHSMLEASNQLHISQPSITKALKKLEDEFGFQLFNREKNRLVINEEGKIAVKYAKEVLSLVDELKIATNNVHKQSLELSIGSLAPLPLWAIETSADCNTKSTIIDDENKLIKGLKNHEYSMIILNRPMECKDIISVHICDEQLHIGIKKNHRFSKRKSITFEDLKDEYFLRLNNVGFWHNVTSNYIDKTHILNQDDNHTYQILQESSDLLVFRTSLSMKRYQNQEDRIYIPISDPNATQSFYVCFYNANLSLFKPILDKLPSIDYELFDPPMQK